jgi:hypothetical protein
MTKTRFACVGAATILLWGVACGGGSPPPEEPAETAGNEEPPPPPPPPPPRPAPVRVIHLAAGSAGDTASATAGPEGSPLAQVSDVAFEAASEYVEIQPDAPQMTVPVQVQVGAASASFEVPVRAGTPATLLVLTNPQDPAQVLVSATEDDSAAVMGQIRGRFVNALLGVEAIDFCLPGQGRQPGRPIFTGVQYGQVAGTDTANHYIPISVAAGLRLQVRQAAESGCTGRVIGTAEIPPPDGSVPHNFTLAVVGRASGRPAVARELLVCEDAPNPSGCVALPLR